MPEVPEEVRAIGRREAAAVRQGMIEDSAWRERPIPSDAGCGGGKCTPAHRSNDGDGGSGGGVCADPEASEDYRQALIRDGWAEED